ncbi:MAG: hypothetical protein R3Y54_03525 [Eubacteriales bacterium]
MKFLKDLYCETHLRKKRKWIQWKLTHNKFQLNLYIIALGYQTDQLEMMHVSYLRQEYYKKNPPYVVGIADTKEGAFRVVQAMVQEVYERTGTANIKKYLLDNKE